MASTEAIAFPNSRAYLGIDDQDIELKTTSQSPPISNLRSTFTPTHRAPRAQWFWWLITLIISACIAITIRSYEEHGNLTSGQKHTFNTLVAGLGLILALNFFEAFKSFAKGLRSSILARGPWSDREKELVSNIENLTDVFVLGWESRWISKTAVLCTLWILINIIAQAAVAIIGLTYSINDGRNYNDTYTRPGIAKAANLTCYHDFFNGGPCGNRITTQTLAHAYGEMILNYDCGHYNDTSPILASPVDYKYFCRRHQKPQEFAYRFSEYNTDDTDKIYPQFTNRVITASSGECRKYTMVGEPKNLDGGKDLYTFQNDTYKGHITIPNQYTARDGTTYIYRGIKEPQHADEYRCGPRCITMWAHKSRRFREDDPKGSVFYECPITVSTVSNTNNKTQEISDGIALLAAASIGLSGRQSDGPPGQWRQYQLYSFGSAYEVHFQDTEKVGANMAEFAIGSLAFMASTNRQIDVKGAVPYLGSRIAVHWYYVIPLLAGISGMHLVLVLAGN